MFCCIKQILERRKGTDHAERKAAKRVFRMTISVTHLAEIDTPFEVKAMIQFDTKLSRLPAIMAQRWGRPTHPKNEKDNELNK